MAAQDLALGVDTVFVTSAEEGVKAVDVTDPAHPRPLATYDVVPWLTRLALRDRQLFVLHYQAPPLHDPPTITHLDVTDALRPTLRDQVPLPAFGLPADRSTELVLGDTALYVVGPDHGGMRHWAMDGFDLTDDRAPLFRDVYWLRGRWAPVVGVTGDLLLLADTELRLLRLMPAEIPRP